jgi:U3 small nucleolar RNA-associated protein 5
MLPDPAVNILAPSDMSHVETSTTDSSSPEVICASATPYSVHLTSSTDHQIDKFDSFKNAIHTIIRSGQAESNSSGLFLAADSDRYINMYDIGQKRLSRTLVVNSGVDALSVSALGDEEDRSPSPLLAVTTEAGIVELFSNPFQQPPKQAELNSIKSKRKGLTRKASASIKLIRPDKEGVIVPIFQALVQGPDVVVASTDGGVDVSFQKVRWQDEGTGELLFDGTREVFRSKSASSLNTATMNGVKDIGNVHMDESKVVVIGAGAQGTSQDAVIEISSGEDEDTEDAEEEESEVDAKDEDDDNSIQEDTNMVDPDDALRDHQEQIQDKAEPELEDISAEPTFGERLAAKNPDTISIANALGPSASSTLVATRPEKSLSIPSGVSLSTVLTQSLRTSDQNLLESCFHTTDLNTIRLTIQRLDPSLAGVLIQKLTERLSSRPGRYGHLLVWVQWTCIAHGGAIAGRPEIASKIKTLYKVLNERSQSLDHLLLLKGKLDMLDAQLTLRRQLQADRGPARDPDDEDDVIYIEGQEEDFSSDEDETAETAVRVTKSRPPKKALLDLIEEEAESEDDEDMPLTNGIQHSDDGDDDADSDEEAVEEEGGGLVDDEAVESNEDSHPSDQEEELEEEDEDTDEVDSEMDSFINDGSIEVDSESDIDVDDTPEKPPSKKTKRA